MENHPNQNRKQNSYKIIYVIHLKGNHSSFSVEQTPITVWSLCLSELRLIYMSDFRVRFRIRIFKNKPAGLMRNQTKV
jgi:hypothetical protein